MYKKNSIAFGFAHSQALVRAVPRAYPAVVAYDRLARVFVVTDRLRHAGALAAPAADALLRFQKHAAALAQSQSAGRADLGAVRLPARMANDRYKLAGKAAARADMYAALSDRMVFAVDPGADKHTGKTPDAFVHFVSY